MAQDSTTKPRRWDNPKPWAWMYQSLTWKGLRVFVRNRDPLCKICDRRPTKVVDHIKPHRGDWNLFIDEKNLQGLCKECHDRKTATEDGGFGNPVQDPNAPVATGGDGKQFSSTSVGSAKLDKALDVDLDELLDVDLD